MASAQVILQLSNQAAPEIRRTASEAKALAAEEERATRAALQHAQAMARLQATSGQLARAEQTLTQAIAKTNTESIEAIRAQTQLAAVQNKASRESSGFASKLGSVKSALGGLGLAIGVRDLIQFGQEAGQAGLALQRTQRLTEQIAGSQARYNEVVTAAKAQQLLFGGTLKENIDQLSGFAVQSRLTGARLEDLIDTAQRLSTLDPAQGIEGASVALREALSGDPVSLARRFEIPRAELAKLRDTSTTAAQKLQVIGDFLDKAGIKSGALAGAVSDTEKTYLSLNATLDSATTKFGLLVAQGLEPAARGLERIIRITQGGNDAFAEIGQSLAGFNAAVQNSTTAAFNPAIKAIAAYNTEAIKLLGLVAEWSGVVQSSTPVVEQASQETNLLAGAQAHLRDEHLTSSQAIQVTSAQLQEFNANLAENAAKAQISAAESAVLKARQEEIAQASVLAARGMLGSGDQALLMARKFGIAADEAAFLIQQQQRLDAAQGLRDQRAGERSGGAVRSEAELRAQGAARRLNADYEREQADKQRQIQQAQNALDLTRAKTAGQRIAIYQRELAATTDIAERLRIQAQIEQEKNSGAKAHTSELGKQLNLEERIRDSKEAQYKAALDAREAEIRDRQESRKEDQDLRKHRNALQNARDPRIRAAAADAIDLIDVHRQQRQLDLAEKSATAGGTIINGRVFQSRPGATLPGAPSLPSGVPTIGAAPTGAAAGAGVGVQVNVFLDSEQIAARFESRVITGLRDSRQQVAATGGRIP